MPEMDGYATTGAIRRIPRFTDLLVIAVTVRALPEDGEMTRLRRRMAPAQLTPGGGLNDRKLGRVHWRERRLPGQHPHYLMCGKITDCTDRLFGVLGGWTWCHDPGPSEPAGYSSKGTRSFDQADSTGATTRQASSASSPRIDKAAFPFSTSSRSRP